MHITSIGAGLFSDLAVAATDVPLSASAIAALDEAAEFMALFESEIASQGGVVSDLAGSRTFIRLKNVREFPSMGTPPNVINVPVYGSKTSQQIQGQADAPSLEVTLNYVPAEWADEVTNLLGSMVGDGKQHIFRFTLLNAEPTGTGATKYASTAAGLGTVGNSQYFWVGKLEALQVNPQLTDSNTATVTMTIQSEFFGAYTIG